MRGTPGGVCDRAPMGVPRPPPVLPSALRAYTTYHIPAATPRAGSLGEARAAKHKASPPLAGHDQYDEPTSRHLGHTLQL